MRGTLHFVRVKWAESEAMGADLTAQIEALAPKPRRPAERVRYEATIEGMTESEEYGVTVLVRIVVP